jgi:ribonucleoside-triphosphate reductase
VETIQDMIRNFLITKNKYQVVESFILYRDERDRVRQDNTKLMKEITVKLKASDVQNQNANVDEESFGGRMGEASSVVLKNRALAYMSKKSKDNHNNNEVYIHDLDQYILGNHNCLSYPLDESLGRGFTVRQTDVRPANSVNTAMQLVAVLFQVQSLQQFGGVSGTHLDWTMVPYVRKSFFKHYKTGLKYIKGLSDDEIDVISQAITEKADNAHDSTLGEILYNDFGKTYPMPASDKLPEAFKPTGIGKLSIDDEIYKQYENVYNYALDMTTKETNQAVEGLYHNLNTLQSRSGCQLPFSSINYGTCPKVEGRMVIKACLETSIAGLGTKHRTSVFPCGIFQYFKDVNGAPGTPNYDMYRLALASTATRLYPNYANFEWSGNAGYDIDDPRTYFSTMGKRNTTAHLKSGEPCLWGVAA